MNRATTPTPELEVAAVVALMRSGRQPSAVYADLVEEAGSARPVLDEEQGLLAPQLLDEAAGDVARWARQEIRLVTVLDPSYPDNLRVVFDRPLLLFVFGGIEPGDCQSVALIGSRRASAAGLAAARTIASHLAVSGYTIVSGLAAGIDTAAHTETLAAGGRTIAVIGTGLHHSYPPQNASLQRRIAAEGALISQFWPDTGPDPHNFPLRNALMSGLALATVVVEATHTSGARTQVRAALAHGRPVLLAGKLLDQQWARDAAARPGVYVFRSLPELDEVIASVSSADELIA